MKKALWQYYLLTLFVVLIDQSLKLWVYFNMELGPHGAISVLGNWFKIHYTLNPGMAFGIQFGFKYGKLLLTWGRIVASLLIAQYMWRLWRQEEKLREHLWGWALILGGALGNVIDSTFYGVLLGNAPYKAPMRWFHGQVIDMLYLNIWEAEIPGWVPMVGKHYYSIFPIFNMADASILLGILILVGIRRRQQMHERQEAAPRSWATEGTKPL